MTDEIARRNRLSWLALASRLAAVALVCLSLWLEHQELRWILLAAAAGLAVVPIAWRRKAAVVPGALFARMQRARDL
jgi:hypothetical protein